MKIFYSKFKVTFLLLTLIIFLGFVNVESIGASEPSLLFSPERINSLVGQQFDIEIRVDTAGQSTGGVGAKMLFDKANLKVVNITKGSIFDYYPISAFNNASGNISISGIKYPSSDLFIGEGLFATITFEPIAVGASSATFVFEQGSTRDSNIAVSFGNGDILAKVNKLNVTSEWSGEYESDNSNRSEPPKLSKPGVGQMLLEGLLNTFENLGLSAESIQIFATRVVGKEMTMEEIAELNGSKSDTNQSQPSLVNSIFKSSKKPLEKTLTALLIITLIVIPFIWLVYFIFKKRKHSE